jgi:hypothetical protein
MQNLVGDNAPSEQTFGTYLKTLRGLETEFKAFCITLGPAERKRLLHARLGAEPHIARVQELAAKFGVNIEGIPTAGMMADLALWISLRAVQDVLRSLLQWVDDTAGEAESEAWQAFLAYYGALSAIAPRVPALAVLLAPTVEFMATGARKKAGVGKTGGAGTTGGTGTAGPAAHG